MTNLYYVMKASIEGDMKALEKTSNLDYFEGRIRVAITALVENGDITKFEGEKMLQEMIALIDKRRGY